MYERWRMRPRRQVWFQGASGRGFARAARGCTAPVVNSVRRTAPRRVGLVGTRGPERGRRRRRIFLDGWLVPARETGNLNVTVRASLRAGEGCALRCAVAEPAGRPVAVAAVKIDSETSSLRCERCATPRRSCYLLGSCAAPAKTPLSWRRPALRDDIEWRMSGAPRSAKYSGSHSSCSGVAYNQSVQTVP